MLHDVDDSRRLVALRYLLYSCLAFFRSQMHDVDESVYVILSCNANCMVYPQTMEKELSNIESEHVLMMERVMQCRRAQVAMAQNVVEAVALLESRRIRDRPMTQSEEQMLATLDKIKVCLVFGHSGSSLNASPCSGQLMRQERRLGVAIFLLYYRADRRTSVWQSQLLS